MAYTLSVNGKNYQVRDSDYQLEVYLKPTIDEKRPAGCTTSISISFENNLLRFTSEPVIAQPVSHKWNNGVLTVQGAPDEGEPLSVVFFLGLKQGVAGQETIQINAKITNPKGKDVLNINRKKKLKLVQANGYGNKPDKPTDVVFSPFGPGWATIKWNAHPSTEWTEIQYRYIHSNIWINTGELIPGLTDGSLGVAGTDECEYEISGLQENTEYEMRMRARSTEFGNSAWTKQYKIKTANKPPSIWATGVRPVFVPVSNSEISIAWRLDLYQSQSTPYNGGHFKYWILYSTDNSAPIESWTEVYAGVDILEYNLSGLQSNTKYYIRIKCEIYGTVAVNQFDPPSATTKLDPNAATAPTGFTAETIKSKSITLEWDAYNIASGSFILSMSTGVGNNSYNVIATLARNVTSYTVDGLNPSTTYNFQLAMKTNVIGASASTSAETLAPQVAPSAPQNLKAVGYSPNGVRVDWEAPTTGVVDGYYIYSSLDDDTFDLVGNILSNSTAYIVTGLEESTSYFFRVVAYNDGGNSPQSDSVEATTLERSTTFAPECPFTLNGQSKNSIVEVDTGVLITSDLDRWIVRTNNGYWFQAGLKPQLEGGVLTAEEGGILKDGEYTAYVCLFRSYDQVRSLPSPVSNTATINGDNARRLTFQPQTLGDLVAVRDFGYDFYGNIIEGCDFWELYLTESGESKAWLIGRYPIQCDQWENSVGSKTLDIPVTLDYNNIFGGNRRPMEIQLECSLPPACHTAYVNGNRVVAFGDATITPTSQELVNGASITINTGDGFFTKSGFAAGDECIYHRLFIEGGNTGWEIWDVEGNKFFIRNPDPDINALGYNGIGGTYTDFSFEGNPSRVYFSGYYNGEANGNTTFSPQTFPPLTISDTDFFPNDNSNPKAVIASRSNLLVAKDSKWILVSGGSEPDFPLIQTTKISDSSGILATKSLTSTKDDDCFYIGDSGAYMVNSSGVQKLSVNTGNKHIFENVFDISSMSDAVGTWLSREDWYIVANINRIGNVGRTDGFIFDVKANAILPFSTPYQITYMKQFLSAAGDYQVMFGTTGGRIGYMFKRELYTDGKDYTEQVPEISAEPIRGYIQGGVTDTDQTMTMRYVRPRIKTYPYDVDFVFQTQLFGVDRIDQPNINRRGVTARFSTLDKRDHFSLRGNRFQQFVVQVEFTTSTEQDFAMFEMKDLQVAAIARGNGI